MSEELFIYGTLRLPEIQLEIIGRKVEMKADVLKGYKTAVVFVAGIECLTLVADEKSGIEGAIISITSNELARVDAYEPHEYERMRVTTASGSTVWVYVKA